MCTSTRRRRPRRTFRCGVRRSTCLRSREIYLALGVDLATVGVLGDYRSERERIDASRPNPRTPSDYPRAWLGCIPEREAPLDELLEVGDSELAQTV